MKKLLITILLLSPLIIYSQTSWIFNFDNAYGTASHTAGESSTFLPTPPTNGGTARVRIGTGAGSFNLNNPGTSLGSNYELNGVASSSGSVNKFSIQNHTGAKFLKTSFKIRLNGGTSGSWYFFQGTGATYTGNSAFTGNQVFTGLRFVFGASGIITTSRREGAVWNVTALTAINSQATDYLVEIYSNNSNLAASYIKTGAQTLAINTWDLWVNGVLIGNDLGKAQLIDDTPIDSFTFYGENSSSNVANIYLDDISYANENQTFTLPITLTSFTGKEFNKSIVLNWVTASEKNNKDFEILSSIDGKVFKIIGTIDGAGDSDAELKYSFVDVNPFGGTNYYQLKQIDFDGKSSTSSTIAVDSKIAETHISIFAAISKVHIGITSPNETAGKLSLFDIGGRKIMIQNVKLNKGYNSIELNENLNPGVHFVTLENEGKLHHQKFIK